MKFGAVFLMLLVAGSLTAAVRPRVEPTPSDQPSVAANARLTAVNGALLFVMLIAIAMSVLLIGQFLALHFVIGFMLIPPLALKLYTTGYRFTKYYTGDPVFRTAGPPPLFLRLVVAPALVASAVVVMATGLELWAFGDRFGVLWLSTHTASAVVFMAAVFLHLISHSRQSAISLVEDAAANPGPGAITRRSLMLGCIISSCVLGAASLTYASPFAATGGG